MIDCLRVDMNTINITETYPQCLYTYNNYEKANRPLPFGGGSVFSGTKHTIIIIKRIYFSLFVLFFDRLAKYKELIRLFKDVSRLTSPKICA
ncbi:hypothetical protein C0V77_18965 [Emticicia sp. TH156]|nr:hypothetical protein C0V77_18965 [Emticicia sp. TH156]